MKDALNIIVAPLVTEKLTERAQTANVVAFRVAPDANKLDIHRAVEQIWKVKVLDVRTMSCRGKKRRMGRFVGKRPDWKKAIVTLAEGQTIAEFS